MKILVPVDGSAYSLKAVETACDLAKAQAPATIVLTAVAIQIPELEEGVYIAEKMKAQAEIALAKAKEVAQAKGITAEVVLANILADVLIRFARELVAAVAPGGTLVLSGILAAECAQVKKTFAAVAPGWAIKSRTLGEWSDVVLTRPA